MKSIANQYKDLKEGKMSQANFMRNLRMSMPQVTNTMSFGDAVKVLKNKGIITESFDPAQDAENAKYKSPMDRMYNSDDYIKAQKDEKGSDDDAEFDAILKQLEDEMSGEEAVKGQYDETMNEESGLEQFKTGMKIHKKGKPDETFTVQMVQPSTVKGMEAAMALHLKNDKTGQEFRDSPGNYEIIETLNEAKETTNPNKVHPQEYTMGIRYELKCFKGDVVKAERAVLKNLAKEPFYYTALKLAGKDIHKEAPAVKAEAPKKKSKKKEVELVDTINAMQKVKMPKAEEKKKLKEQVDEKMRFQDLPADPEKYKMVKDSKGYIIKATNADNVEFQKGDVVKTYDGEEIKIVKFEESQGKVKAIYNKGMFFAGIDIDGLEAPKPTMRPGVDIGKSFEKFKNKIAEIIREITAENK